MMATAPPRMNTRPEGRPINRATSSRGRTRRRACDAHAARPSSYAHLARRSRRASAMGNTGLPPGGAESFERALQALAKGRRSGGTFTRQGEMDRLRIGWPQRAEDLERGGVKVSLDARVLRGRAGSGEGEEPRL